MVAKPGYIVAYCRIPEIEFNNELKLKNIGFIKAEVISVKNYDDDSYEYKLDNGDTVCNHNCVIDNFGEDGALIAKALINSGKITLGARFQYDYVHRERLRKLNNELVSDS